MKNLNQFKTFVDEINLENGRNYKLSVLEKYKDDDCIKYFLQLVYDPFIVFGISEKKLNKDVGHQLGSIWLDYPEDSEIFEYLKIHNTGTDKDIWTVQQFKKTQICDECKELFDNIITKNLQIGVDTKSINKVIPKLIPEFNVQLANKYFEDPDVVEGKEFTLTPKIDGFRCVALKKDGKVSFWTRQGQPYEGLVDLENEMLEQIPDNTCLDGELTIYDKGNMVSKEQYKAASKILRTDGEKHGIKMRVFDIMDATEFEAQKCTTPYKQRRERLEHLGERSRLTFFEVLDNLYTGKDTKEIHRILKCCVDAGEEGIMINVTDAPYEFKRCSTLLKCKLMKDLDLEVIGYEEGSNSNKGKLGAFLVRYKDGNTVKVGSGFSKELREEIWKDPDSYIGKIITVKYFEETENANGGKSLRFPVFVDFRFDKNTPDY